MSKLAHSNQETMDEIERKHREDEERRLRDEPPCPSCSHGGLPKRLHRTNPDSPAGVLPLYVCADCRR
jgi:hypothetical protein